MINDKYHHQLKDVKLQLFVRHTMDVRWTLKKHCVFYFLEAVVLTSIQHHLNVMDVETFGACLLVPDRLCIVLILYCINN